MEKLRRYALTLGTVCVALGIGYVMQMDATPESLGYGPVKQAAAMTPVAEDEPELEVQSLVLTSSSESDASPVVMAALDTPVSPAPSIVTAVPEPVCDLAATAETAAGAMVTLSVAAPCLPDAPVTVHHNGMMFTEVTDDQGRLSVSVPALSKQAVFIVQFAQGKGAVAVAQVPDLDLYDRVVLQWAGESGFQMHAREFGASYGDPGHVWSGAPRTPDAAVSGDRGFLTHLGVSVGASPRIAEVYTFPSATAARDGKVALSIETEVSQGNCGRQIEAEALELREDGVLRTSDVVLAVPACAAIGDFLVLNNLLDDLRIAAR